MPHLVLIAIIKILGLMAIPFVVMMPIFRKIFRRIHGWLSAEWMRASAKWRLRGISSSQLLETSFDFLYRANEAADGKGISVGWYLGEGWRPGHPEISGYVLCTLRMLAERGQWSNTDLSSRCEKVAIRTTRWLMDDLYVKGCGYLGYQGEGKEAQGLVFDTGQILHGFLSVYQWLPDVCDLEKIRSVVKWLCDNMSEDGAWRRGTYWGGEAPPYYLRVTWALIRAAKILNDPICAEFAYKNFDYFLVQVNREHWDGFIPRLVEEPYLNILHFYAYTIQGAIECASAMKNDSMLRFADRTLSWLTDEFFKHEILPGRINRYGRGGNRFRCMTGEFQIAICCFRLAKLMDRPDYAEAGRKIFDKALEGWVSPSHAVKDAWKGGVWGSLPVHQQYQPWTLICWGAKFLIDAAIISEGAEDRVGQLISQGELA